ncbi:MULTISPECIES: sulfite exporter TauE/SafE family protein [unclassified Nocardia]|uniref:sulfite exporter TauE/SafE family protein n=1 Tax=unclassified Nocardia TaxID=2637762 RepID=UPI001CE4A42C|nr:MULTISPECIES: sulfite exporter TauE/SafE family protein [unclassified Nocardia]
MWISLLVMMGFGCLTGITTVLFGFGGGFVTVPVIYAVSAATSGSEAMHIAVATSAAVMVVNATIATVTHARSGGLRRDYLHPLWVFIAVGALVGALAANTVSDKTLHILFAAYLLVAIADIVLRGGFLTRATRPEPLGKTMSILGGVGIGTVAAFLGVGGSVVTVPLLRRRGLSMAEAAALANPLSIPVALVATLVYAFAAQSDSRQGLFGHVDLVAALALLAGALPTIALVKRSVVRIPDHLHAIGYPMFLTIVLIVMTATAFT